MMSMENAVDLVLDILARATKLRESLLILGCSEEEIIEAKKRFVEKEIKNKFSEEEQEKLVSIVFEQLSLMYEEQEKNKSSFVR